MFAEEVLNYDASASDNSSPHPWGKLLGFPLGMWYPSRVPNYLCSWRSTDLKDLPYPSSAICNRKKGKCPHTVYCLLIRLIPCLWRQVAQNYSRPAASRSYSCSSLALGLHQGGRANVCTFFFSLIQSTACAQRQPAFCHYTEDIQAHLKTKKKPNFTWHRVICRNMKIP